MKFFQKRSFFSFMIALGVGANLFCGAVLTARAEVIDYQALAEANLSIPVESNEIKNWPEGPILNARSAILMDADSGAILYAKNIHEKLYPASTTKILTAYIARQNSELNEMIEYSDTAVHSIDWRSDSNIGIKAGDIAIGIRHRKRRVGPFGADHQLALGGAGVHVAHGGHAVCGVVVGMQLAQAQDGAVVLLHVDHLPRLDGGGDLLAAGDEVDAAHRFVVLAHPVVAAR